MRNRQAAIPFIFVTVMLDMVALGLIAPVLPNLILSFVNNDMTRTAIWNGNFSHRLCRDAVFLFAGDRRFV
jgi:DHA1 family tetracycline resistance protein-like MFS transporter